MLEKPTKNKRKVEGLNDKKKMRSFSGSLVFVLLLSTVHIVSGYDAFSDAREASMKIHTKTCNNTTGKSSFFILSPSEGENLIEHFNKVNLF